MISPGLPIPHVFSESDGVSRSWCQHLSSDPVKKSPEETIENGKCHSPCLTGVLLGRLYPNKVSKGERTQTEKLEWSRPGFSAEPMALAASRKQSWLIGPFWNLPALVVPKDWEEKNDPYSPPHMPTLRKAWLCSRGRVEVKGESGRGTWSLIGWFTR